MQAGYCILGCTYGAKQSMLVTYVPRAERAGARIYADARAERSEAEHASWRARDRAVVRAPQSVQARPDSVAYGGDGARNGALGVRRGSERAAAAVELFGLGLAVEAVGRYRAGDRALRRDHVSS